MTLCRGSQVLENLREISYSLILFGTNWSVRMADFRSKMLAFQSSIKDFYKSILLYFFANRKQQKNTTKRCIFYFENHDIHLMYVDCTPNLMRVIALEKYKFKTDKELIELFGRISRQYNLQTVPIYWILNDKDYQIFFLEPMAVPENELRQALTWRLKNSLQKMGETIVDYFKLPSKSSAPNQEMIAAVVASQDSIKKFLSICGTYRMNVNVIDIPELVLHNLTSLEENDDKGTALIYIKAGTCILNISKNKILFLTRKIVIRFNKEENNLKEVSLEIIRYFDYFQSYWRHPPPSRVHLIAEKENESELAQALSQLLALKIMPFSFDYPIATSTPINDVNLLLLGAAFRELDHVKTEH